MNSFDIYLARIPFHEKDGRYKDRPVVILNTSVSAEVAPITGTLYGDKYILKDWRRENLAKESAVYLPTHILNIDSDIKDLSLSGEGVYIGTLTERDKQGLINFLEDHDIEI